MSCCANCGVAADGNGIKLKTCTACKSVKYCGVKCQKEHRPKHKRACKKRAAELHDEILFKQPESSHHGDCPICFLPMPLSCKQGTFMECCSKVICDGCFYTAGKSNFVEKKNSTCPFCREPFENSEGFRKKAKARLEINDPFALCEEGKFHWRNKDFATAFKFLSKAAECGDVGAHHELAGMYHHEEGVEMDEAKRLYHWEQACIGGHPAARHDLGLLEGKNGRLDRATKHFIIGAKLGNDECLERLKTGYKGGLVSKDDLTTALRGHQAAIDAMKSPSREEAARVFKGTDRTYESHSLQTN